VYTAILTGPDLRIKKLRRFELLQIYRYQFESSCTNRIGDRIPYEYK
jgi:hypothetical protein